MAIHTFCRLGFSLYGFRKTVVAGENQLFICSLIFVLGFLLHTFFLYAFSDMTYFKITEDNLKI